MELQRDIALFCHSHDQFDVASRLMLSSGMQKAAGFHKAPIFCDSAVIPKEPWHPVTSEQFKDCFDSNSSTGLSPWISIIQIPLPILELFRPLREISELHKSADFINELIYNDPSYEIGLEAATEFCARFNKEGECLKKGTGIRANRPQLITVTENKERSCLIGLHLDSWFRAPLSERHLSPNRFCFNLGSEDRYLLFINLSLQQIAACIQSAQSVGCPAPQFETDLLIPFLYLFPSYPVTCLKVKPGEAYIAPTENMFHDGSTIGRSTADVQLTVLGNFEARMVLSI
mgnify:CR=1 FL=1